MNDYKKFSEITPTTSPPADARVIITSSAGDFSVPLYALVRPDPTISSPAKLPASAAIGEVRWFRDTALDALSCWEFRADGKWHKLA